MQISWEQIVLSSLVLPAIVALLVSWFEARRRDNRDRVNWFDNIISAAGGIDNGWYKHSGLTNEKQQNTIEIVSEYVDRLNERKNSVLSPSELTEAIELLDRKWIDAKDTLPVNRGSTYQSLGNSVRRTARQVGYIAEQNRPKPLQERLSWYRPHPIDRLKRFRELGFERGRVRYFSYDNVSVLRDYFSVEEINQIEKGEVTIRVTSPFDSRFCVRQPDSGEPGFVCVEGFSRFSSRKLHVSFRTFPITEDQLMQELKYAHERELEDIEKTQEIIFEYGDFSEQSALLKTC